MADEVTPHACIGDVKVIVSTEFFHKENVMLFSPKPKFPIGILVVATFQESQSSEYMFIGSRRWICPNGHKDKRWVYDGTIYCVDGDQIKMSTQVSCVSEENISPLP